MTVAPLRIITVLATVALLCDVLRTMGSSSVPQPITRPVMLPQNCREVRLLGAVSNGDYLVYPANSARPSKVHCDLTTDHVVPGDCRDVLLQGAASSGIYSVHPQGSVMSVNVYCDLTTDGGGWTVFQRRQDGSENFYRDWDAYRLGFGNLDGEMWLGNEALNALTLQGSYVLRIDMEDWDGNKAYAEYSTFRVGTSARNFPITLGAYTNGTAGDAMNGISYRGFSTKGHDNDFHPQVHCAEYLKSAFWYNDCGRTNLNGKYVVGGHATSSNVKVIYWETWKRTNYGLKVTEMKLRPAIAQIRRLPAPEEPDANSPFVD